MTKEITKSYILQQMEDKFKLRDLIAEKFSFSEMVLPIYNIEPHIQEWKSAGKDVSITAEVGFDFHVVPSTARWTLLNYNVIFLGAGAFTVGGVYITRKLSGVAIYLDLVAGQTVSYAHYLTAPLQLDSGDKISVLIDGYTSTQNLRLNIDYREETIR